ncbi:MAG: hypothetical protein RI101_09715 [Nitrospira sp.]|jgi:hypothetical protein|nr:hypothetical protein [Nitrospira sp.]
MQRDWRRIVGIACIGGMVLGWSLQSWAAEPVTPIGTLWGNPSALHRKVMKLEGIAKAVVGYSGTDLGTNQALCGADFKLDDETGSIDVAYHVRCQAGEDRATTVVDGQRVSVDGYLEAPPTMLHTGEGKDLGVMFVARTVTIVKR